jgi:SAM-dependent methyltransferase
MNPFYQAAKKVAGAARYPLTLRSVIALQRRFLDADLAFQERWGESARRASSCISSRDEMYFGVLRTYFTVGLSGLECIEEAMGAAKIRSPHRVLDLPSGHGRVLRFIVERFPEAQVMACDLGSDEVNFCAATFGARAVVSRTNIEALTLDERFDLIWCGSLITHLDGPRIEVLLRFFHRHLEPGGLLVFSTHGDHAVDNLRDGNLFSYGLSSNATQLTLRSYASTGFGYSDYDTGKNPGYGVSFTSAAWIHGALERVGGFREVYCAEKGFGDHQDTYGVVRTADAGVPSHN